MARQGKARHEPQELALDGEPVAFVGRSRGGQTDVTAYAGGPHGVDDGAGPVGDRCARGAASKRWAEGADEGSGTPRRRGQLPRRRRAHLGRRRAAAVVLEA